MSGYGSWGIEYMSFPNVTVHKPKSRGQLEDGERADIERVITVEESAANGAANGPSKETTK